jgi:phage gp29-like protein
MLERVSKRRSKRRGELAVVRSSTGGAQPGTAIAALRSSTPSGFEVGNVAKAMMPQPMSFFDLDRVGQMKSVIRTFEASSFEAAAGFADLMLRDDRIHGCFMTRIEALIASDLSVTGASQKRLDRKLAERIGGTDEFPGIWDDMFPPEAVGDLLFWGRMLGIGVAEILWDTKTNRDEWGFTIRVWHPQHIRWEEQKGVYQVVQAGGDPIDLPSLEEFPHGDGKWIIYAPYGYRAVWRRALMRPLAMAYLCRQWCVRDWARYNEKHGLPADVARVPENAPIEEKAKFMTDVAARGSETVVFMPATDPAAAQYDFKIVEPMGNSYQGFDAFLGRMDSNIAIAVKGNNLTTEVQEGSRASAQVHAGVDARILASDARIFPVLVRQGLYHWVRANFGEKAGIPFVRKVVEEPADELKMAQTMDTVGAAVLAMQLAGMPVDTEAVAALWKIPMRVEDPEDEDDVGAAPAGGGVELTPSALSAIVTVNEARASAGMGPLLLPGGGRDPDGDLTVAEFQAKNAATIAVAAQAEAGNDKTNEDPNKDPHEDPFAGADARAGQRAGVPAGERPRKGTRAGAGAGVNEDPDEDADEETNEATLSRGLERMAEEMSPRLLARMSTRAHGHVAGHARTGKYADAVEAAAKLRAKQAVAVSLKSILDVIRSTEDGPNWGERLRRKLVDKYPRMRGEVLARVVERANIMAHLAGRLGVIEEV